MRPGGTCPSATGRGALIRANRRRTGALLRKGRPRKRPPLGSGLPLCGPFGATLDVDAFRTVAAFRPPLAAYSFAVALKASLCRSRQGPPYPCPWRPRLPLPSARRCLQRDREGQHELPGQKRAATRLACSSTRDRHVLRASRSNRLHVARVGPTGASASPDTRGALRRTCLRCPSERDTPAGQGTAGSTQARRNTTPWPCGCGCSAR